MTRKQEVADFLKEKQGVTFCDDCLCKKLSFTVRQHANHITNKLKGQPGFFREKGSCSVCKKEKLVIKAL